MKALSLTQPWATLLALGEKKVETRSWGRRGAEGQRIAIHAALRFPAESRMLLDEEPFASRLAYHGITSGNQTQANLPRGVIIAVASLQIVTQTELVRHKLSAQELAFGNYEDGRYAWVFADIVKLNTPILCRGMLGLWTVPADTAGQIEYQRSNS